MNNRLNRLKFTLDQLNEVYRNLANLLCISQPKMEIYYCLLAEDGSCPLSEICSYMSIPKQTLNSQLRSMEKDGDIKVDYLPNSKKNKAAVLTEKGMKQARATAGLMQKFETKALTSFTQQEVEILFSLLERFTDEMDKQVKSLQDEEI